MKKALFVFLIMVIGICLFQNTKFNNYSVGARELINQYNGTLELAEDWKNEVYSWDNGRALPFPKPDAGSLQITSSAYNEFVCECKEINSQDFERYKTVLSNHGWKKIFNTDYVSNNYIYIKNNRMITINDQTFVSKSNSSLENYISIYFYNGVTENDSRSNPITKAQAKSIIQKKIKDTKDNKSLNGKTVTDLVEKDITDIYEKMGLQAFEAFNEKGTLGNFLVCKDSALYVFDSLEKTCVADIDHDGAYEFISIYGFGSGIYQINLSAYKFGNCPGDDSRKESVYRAYNSCWIPDKGYQELTIRQMSNTEVKLFSIELTGEKWRQTADYGLLKVENGSFVPQSSENFPFRQW